MAQKLYTRTIRLPEVVAKALKAAAKASYNSENKEILNALIKHLKLKKNEFPDQAHK